MHIAVRLVFRQKELGRLIMPLIGFKKMLIDLCSPFTAVIYIFNVKATDVIWIRYNWVPQRAHQLKQRGRPRFCTGVTNCFSLDISEVCGFFISRKRCNAVVLCHLKMYVCFLFIGVFIFTNILIIP